MDADNDILLAQYLWNSACLACRVTIRSVGQYRVKGHGVQKSKKNRNNTPYLQNKTRFLVVLMTTCADNILNDYVLAIWQKISNYYNQSTKSTKIERFREKR